MSTIGAIKSDVSLVREIYIAASNLRKGVSAPSDELVGTTPSIPVTRFANTNELLSAGIIMPPNWDKTLPITVIADWALNTTEVAGDVMDLNVNYLVYTTPVQGGNSILKTSTNGTSSFTVTASRGLIAGSVYRTVNLLDPRDADNPFAGGLGLAIEINMLNTTGVASIDLIGALFQIPTTF